ncbi:PQQ-dependent sugar dehydrogenase [soil metagenome]
MPFAAILTFFLGLAVLSSAAAAQERHQTSAGAVEVSRVMSGLSAPWAVAFLPEGYLVTERGGRLLHVRAGGFTAVEGVPQVRARGQGGLLDVVAARDFAQSREIFLTYAEPRVGGTAGTAAAVARLSGDGGRLENLRVIFRQNDPSGAGQHFGSRIVEAPDGTLFITMGDRGYRDAAQDLASHKGKLIRVGRDGSVPADNPFVGRAGARPEIWSFGLRNLQGAALGPDGALWTVMHGPRGGDEVNRHAQPGLNYGWPLQSFGAEYMTRRQVGTAGPVAGVTDPLYWWEASPAVSGLAIVSGRLFPQWQGDLLVGALQHDTIIRLTGDGSGVAEAERLFEGRYARIRDVREAPNGAIWFIVEGEGAIYRMVPAR